MLGNTKSSQSFHTDTQNVLVVAKGSGAEGGKDWEFGISRCKLVCMERINNKVLLYSTENYTQYPLIDHNGKEWKKRGTNDQIIERQSVLIHPRDFLSSVCLFLFVYILLFKQNGILPETQVMLSQLTTTVGKIFAAFHFFFFFIVSKSQGSKHTCYNIVYHERA